MSENEKDFKQDRFSQLMFGRSRQERPEKQDWILGRKIEHTENNDPKNPTQEKIEQILENVDLDGLMNNFDTLMSSVGELKPLMKKASPFLQKFLNSEK
ncbi:hypothetical protein [Cytobacillus gottheilii]|uniref:hypothetical protein n=1 Tax=Cytobacillus gottheilii TaxID=859144 RepID=UPI0009BC094F|nr:hypothetical protein [Cytobacillus gottheilii]